MDVRPCDDTRVGGGFSEGIEEQVPRIWKKVSRGGNGSYYQSAFPICAGVCRVHAVAVDLGDEEACKALIHQVGHTPIYHTDTIFYGHQVRQYIDSSGTSIHRFIRYINTSIHKVHRYMDSSCRRYIQTHSSGRRYISWLYRLQILCHIQCSLLTLSLSVADDHLCNLFHPRAVSECDAHGWAGRVGAEPRGLRTLRRLGTRAGQGTRHRTHVPGKLISSEEKGRLIH